MNNPTNRRPLLRGRSFSVPAYVVAILALVVSMGGAATAGSMITGKNIKNNTVTSKDIKNSTLHLKDIHPASRPYAPPPSGMTIVGGGVVSGMAPADDNFQRYYAPLSFTAKVPLDEVFFGSPTTIAAPGQSNTEKCSGSATNPTATRGTLCVYVIGSHTNISSGGTFLFPGASADEDGAERNGFYVGSNLDNDGEVRLQFVWAYTAP